MLCDRSELVWAQKSSDKQTECSLEAGNVALYGLREMILILGGQVIAETVSENLCRDVGSVWWDAGHHPPALGLSVACIFLC